ncbi:TPA: hypothetical protein N0F65_002193 [Lagenidium giganteum]|uniref:non-specific serine/threonine protein kinase n=1 Tax=Lagenidium giganteum TaxID=4803 RepID=A0AAV2YKW4_9STRA|nr:TPA: hypothetical protein N0F65_002193 [Lagenidium giganteum]
MATACPWSPVLTKSQPDEPSSPQSLQSPQSMQAIMDEALAVQLYEEECRLLEREINADQLTDPFDRMAMVDKTRYENLLGADSYMEGGNAGDDESDDEITINTAMVRTRTQAAGQQPSQTQSRAAFDRSQQVEGTGSGLNSIRESLRRQDKDAKNGRRGRVEASKRATHGSVLDPRTQILLHKMINKEIFDEVHGCVQSGKEAHVFYAAGTDPDTMKDRHLAVKIFKTTLNEFRNRHEYVTGDRRFDLHFAKKSDSRQIKIWTEKEYKNLCRVMHCKIPAPVPVAFKDHVVVMEFIGSNGWSAPLLKDAELSDAQLRYAYVDVLHSMRTMYQDAKLVHADLSEYNVLYHKQRCWIIDFGQATDETHPEHETFLRRDIDNTNTFFANRGVPVATAEEPGTLSDDDAFLYVTSPAATDLLAAYPSLKARIPRAMA